MKSFSFPLLVILICAQFFTTSCDKNDKTMSMIVEGARVINNDYSVTTGAPHLRRLFPYQDNGGLIGAVAIHDIGDDCAVLHMMSGDYCFTWLNLKNGETRGLIRRGRGPDEMLDAGFSGYRINDKGDTEMIVYSIMKAEAVIINLSQSLSEERTVVLSRQKMPRETMYVLADASNLFCYSFGENRTVGWSVIDEDGESEVIQPFGNNGQVNDPYKFFAAPSVSPDGRFLVMGMVSFPRIFIFDRKGETYAVSLDEKTDAQIVAELNDKGTNMEDCCLWTEIKDNSIFCLVPNNETAKTGSPREWMLIFDMHGKLQSKTSIPDPLSSFMVLPDGRSILGITMDGQIIKYVL